MDEIRQQNDISGEADEQSAFSSAAENENADGQNDAPDGQAATVCEQNAPDGQALSPVSKKKQALIYILCAAIIFVGIYIVQFFNFMRPLFRNVYYGNLTTVFFMILCASFWIPFILVAFFLVRKYAKVNLFIMGKGEIPFKRSLIIYAIAFITIFIISASLGFELKVVKELGKKVTKIKVITNGVTYGYNAIKLILATFIIELIQEAGELLLGHKHKYAKYVPYGGIVLALTFGFAEVIVSYALKTVSVFTWVNILFYLIYGVLYLLGNKRFTITYFVSLIIFIL